MTASSRLAVPRVLVADAALADGYSANVVRGVSLLVEDGVLAGMWTDGDRPGPERLSDVLEIDGSGATIVPGMVDSHAHLSMPGGARWVSHGMDRLDDLLAVGEENGELMVRAGIRWARDVGAPRRAIPELGGDRAVSLLLRDRWQGRQDRPYVRAAGTWITRTGALPEGLSIAVEHGADLVAAVRQQLDDGADLVKLYLDGPDEDVAPFSAAEVTAAVQAAHERGAKVAAHSTRLSGSRVGAQAGVDSIEHGEVLDADTAALMVANDVALVSTLGVEHSWLTFVDTSTEPRFTKETAPGITERIETAGESLRLADQAGVRIAAGSDFGGGSLRANQLAWTVQAMVEAGLSPQSALAAATWRGGELLGLPNAGRLVTGEPAHFTLVHATRCPTRPRCGGCGCPADHRQRSSPTPAVRGGDVAPDEFVGVVGEVEYGVQGFGRRREHRVGRPFAAALHDFAAAVHEVGRAFLGGQQFGVAAEHAIADVPVVLRQRAAVAFVERAELRVRPQHGPNPLEAGHIGAEAGRPSPVHVSDGAVRRGGHPAAQHLR